MVCLLLGTKSFPAEEEEAEGGLRKRKRKRKKRNHLRPAHLGPGGEAVCPEQNGSREPEAGPGKAQQTSAAELGAGAAPSLSRRKRLRKRSLRAQVQSPESAASPPEDAAPGGPASDPTQGVALAGGTPVLKKQRKLGALLVNGSGPPTRAWPLQEGPPARPADGGGCPAAVPQSGELGRKKGEPGGLDLRPPCARKAAVLKKRKKVSQMSPLAAHRGLKLVQALVRRPGQGGAEFRGGSLRVLPPWPAGEPGRVPPQRLRKGRANLKLGQSLPRPKQTPPPRGVDGCVSIGCLAFLLQLIASPGPLQKRRPRIASLVKEETLFPRGSLDKGAVNETPSLGTRLNAFVPETVAGSLADARPLWRCPCCPGCCSRQAAAWL